MSCEKIKEIFFDTSTPTNVIREEFIHHLETCLECAQEYIEFVESHPETLEIVLNHLAQLPTRN